LEDFLGELLAHRTASTAATYYKVLRILYGWLEEEEEIDQNPMVRMKPPIVPDKPVLVIPDDALRRLLKSCAGKDFESRRDTAIIMLLLDTGVRRAELANIQLDHLDLNYQVVRVLSRGRVERLLPFGRRTAQALDRYLRVRARHKDAALPWLWLGLKGRLAAWGIVLMLGRRGREVGLPDLHPHQFRHSFSHQWLADGGGETDLMRLAGWKSCLMLQRYSASAADARAREAHRRSRRSIARRIGHAWERDAPMGQPRTVALGRACGGRSDDVSDQDMCDSSHASIGSGRRWNSR
jgi:integrase/recombinase XerC